MIPGGNPLESVGLRGRGLQESSAVSGGGRTRQMFTLLDLRVSSSRRGHDNLRRPIFITQLKLQTHKCAQQKVMFAFSCPKVQTPGSPLKFSFISIGYIEILICLRL